MLKEEKIKILVDFSLGVYHTQRVYETLNYIFNLINFAIKLTLLDLGMKIDQIRTDCHLRGLVY